MTLALTVIQLAAKLLHYMTSLIYGIKKIDQKNRYKKHIAMEKKRKANNGLKNTNFQLINKQVMTI